MNLSKKLSFIGVFLFIIIPLVLTKAVDNISMNGRCGKNEGICPEGYCCSKLGWCGNSDLHCEAKNGCQSEFGLCKGHKDPNEPTEVSMDGRCGEGLPVCRKGFCCSKWGWCGKTELHCAVKNGCQSKYGTCDKSNDDKGNDYKITNDKLCTARNGQCMNPSKCNTKKNDIINGLCPGGNDNKCCVPNEYATVSNKNDITSDELCNSLGGQCMNPSNCNTKKNGIKSGLCPGGNDNKCCIPNVNDTVLVKDSCTISNFLDAFNRYRSRLGGTCTATKELIKIMKESNNIHIIPFDGFKSFDEKMYELEETIMNKIEKERKKIGDKVENAPNSSLGELWCFPLGSYSVNLEYSFILKEGINHVKVHFSGCNKWDFEWNPDNSYIYNMVEEKLPEFAADFGVPGGGIPFDICYEFSHTIKLDPRSILEKLGDGDIGDAVRDIKETAEDGIEELGNTVGHVLGEVKEGVEEVGSYLNPLNWFD